MTLNQLNAFCVLASTLHYSRAAEALDISQPSLSRMISTLEQELGTHLFQKGRGSIRLSREGQLFYRYVQQGLQELDQGTQAVKSIMDPRMGTVDFAFIYALSTSFVPSLLKEFFSHPENEKIFFQFYQMNSKDIIRKILDGQCDIGLTSFIEDEPLIDFRPITKQEYVLVVSNNHPLARRNSVLLEDAISYPFILPLDRTNFVDHLFQKAGLTPKVTSRVEEDHAAASLVAINLGIAILPKNPALEQYHVKQISFAKPLYRTFYVATAKDKVFTPAANLFYRFLLNHSSGK